MDDGKAESGRDWGFELESIVLEIIGDADQIALESLLDLLVQRPELSTLLASFIEFIQKIPELRKKHGGELDFSRMTIRNELRILLEDLTSGEYHSIIQHGALQKLERKDGNIRRIAKDYDFR